MNKISLSHLFLARFQDLHRVLHTLHKKTMVIKWLQSQYDMLGPYIYTLYNSKKSLDTMLGRGLEGVRRGVGGA